MPSPPSVTIIGAGAAGLWCAIRLLERGCPGARITVIEPDGKAADDRTWSYWTKTEVVPPECLAGSLRQVEIAHAGRRSVYDTSPYRYETLRSSAFYAYAKTVLAKAHVSWTTGYVVEVECLADARVEVAYDVGGDVRYAYSDYVLDSRPPEIDVHDVRFNATLQHFGGYFVRFETPCLDAQTVTFMDFVDLGGETGFFYVIPFNDRKALVELAVLSKSVWQRERYDAALDEYLSDRYDEPYRIEEREYGVIPMTDEPLWRDGTARAWKIGTAAGWVQPSSGYAFTRCARFADEVARALLSARPTPWRPSRVQQVFNSTMLRYVIDYPERAGAVFGRLFARNGAALTFAFLDESAGMSDTLRLMWRSPRTAFAVRALRELGLRSLGSK